MQSMEENNCINSPSSLQGPGLYLLSCERTVGSILGLDLKQNLQFGDKSNSGGEREREREGVLVPPVYGLFAVKEGKLHFFTRDYFLFLLTTLYQDTCFSVKHKQLPFIKIVVSCHYHWHVFGQSTNM